MNRLAEYLDHCADDVKERYQKALKVVGKDNFTYIKVELDNFEEVTKMAVISGFENLPKKYQEDVKSEEWFKYGIVPYMLIEQNNQLNWLVVKSNADYETQDSDRVDKFTLPHALFVAFSNWNNVQMQVWACFIVVNHSVINFQVGVSIFKIFCVFF